MNDALEYDRVRNGIISFKGSEYDEGLKTYNKHYSLNSNSISHNKEVLSEIDMIKSHIYNNETYCKILQNRIDEYNNNNDKTRLRECLETYDEYFSNRNMYIKLWNRIYDKLKKFENTIIFIKNKLVYIDLYFINGYTRLFKMYSRLGYDVRINTNNKTEQSLTINKLPIGFSYKNSKIGKVNIAIRRRIQRLLYKFLNLLFNLGLVDCEKRIKSIVFHNSGLIESPI